MDENSNVVPLCQPDGIGDPPTNALIQPFITQAGGQTI